MFDEKIVKKAIKGNDKAFIILMNQCKEQIYRTAFAYVKEEETALDIVQEVVCKAYKSIENLREPKFFNTWIMRIAINISIDFYGYDEWRSPQDFLNTDLNILINREIPSSWISKVTIVNESTAGIILEANVSNINLGNEVNIDLDINNFTRNII